MLKLSKSIKEATKKVQVSDSDKNKAYDRLDSFLKKRQTLVATLDNSVKKEDKIEIII